MNDITSSLALFSPELLLLTSVLLLLLLGAFTKHNTLIAFGASATIFACLYLLQDHSTERVYAFSEMLDSNAFVVFSKQLVLFSVLLISLSALKEKLRFEFYALMLLSTLGMMLMISSANLLSLYLALELMSLSSYVLVAIDTKNPKSSEAGIKYFILGSIASGIYLLGASFIYGFTGTLSFAGIYEFYLNLASEGESVIMPIGFLIGMVLVVCAFAFKIAAAPFHMWAPDVYHGAPTLVTMFLTSAPKVAGVTILVKLLFDVFADLYIQWQQVLVLLAIISMILGSIAAIMQTNFKRMLAYSSIGHVGFLLCGLVALENEGVQGVLLYLAIYITMTIGAFGIIILLKKDDKNIENIADFAGLAKSHPGTALALLIFMISMAGVPPFAGFFAKFYILLPLLQAEMYKLAIVFIVCSVISAYYYLYVVKVAYFDGDASELSTSSNWLLRYVIIFCAAFNALMILAPNKLIFWTEVASSTFLN